MFEYQSIIADITGMDIANCSLYDDVTAVGEAALMSTRINKKKLFLIPQNLSWEKKSVLTNYTIGADIEIKEIPYDKFSGKLNLKELRGLIDVNTSGVYVENPNYFGIFEDSIDEISDIVKENNSLLIIGLDPFSLGIVKSPGDYDADIVIGEGRSIGNSMNFGGSSLGIFACKKEFLRQMPGRIIGRTKDSEGNTAFCMALQTREQHIRRGRATSNICTNEGLCAIAAVVYLSWLGSSGFEKLSKKNFENGQKLANEIESINGYKKMFSSIHFNEFVIKSKEDADKINRTLLKEGIQGGLIIDKWFKDLKNCMLFGITEIYSEDEINRIISVLKEV
jgi:glycine dehydrogenase subunit 1